LSHGMALHGICQYAMGRIDGWIQYIVHTLNFSTSISKQAGCMDIGTPGMQACKMPDFARAFLVRVFACTYTVPCYSSPLVPLLCSCEAAASRRFCETARLRECVSGTPPPPFFQPSHTLGVIFFAYTPPSSPLCAHGNFGRATTHPTPWRLFRRPGDHGPSLCLVAVGTPSTQVTAPSDSGRAPGLAFLYVIYISTCTLLVSL
jgi:hypothetical protein